MLIIKQVFPSYLIEKKRDIVILVVVADLHFL